jgi:hypothetical protein
VSCVYRSQGVGYLPRLHMTCDVWRERATGIEPAFSAWEARRSRRSDQVKFPKGAGQGAIRVTAGVRC